jgi:hypothetical protein
MSLPTMFQARHYRGLRAAIFTMLGAWGVVPVTQLLLTNGHVWAIRRAFMLDLLMGAIYVVRHSAAALACCVHLITMSSRSCCTGVLLLVRCGFMWRHVQGGPSKYNPAPYCGVRRNSRTQQSGCTKQP